VKKNETPAKNLRVFLNSDWLVLIKFVPGAAMNASEEIWVSAPRLRGDKLRGNDKLCYVLFRATLISIFELKSVSLGS
jgi:hypothetical protein